VNERWVCKRCFADNDDTNATCQRCGLLRGAEATESDQATWSAAQAATTGEAKPAGWTKWLRLWWIPAIAIVLAVGYFATARRGSSGEIENGGSLSAFDIEVGDCFGVEEEGEQIADVDAVPCAQPHVYEAYHVADHETAAFPTQAELDAIFDQLCVASFEPYVGAPYDTSAVWANFMTPSEESYADGDREYVCYLFEPADPNDPLGEKVQHTSSLEGVNR
jgi:hypothetical protein